jgi:hypothetical protein
MNTNNDRIPEFETVWYDKTHNYASYKFTIEPSLQSNAEDLLKRYGVDLREILGRVYRVMKK